MSEQLNTRPDFCDLNLPQTLQDAVKDAGYKTPTPIQAATIPHLLDGTDIIAQAQTGTGKTAAFALPLLTKIDTRSKKPQFLIVTPTRELAIQITEAFEKYAAHIAGFRVVTIYGGQSYDIQIGKLRRGVQVVVGTPGRVMDHMRRGTLSLNELKGIVLDEADEMLHMGFIEDVEWIMDRTPAERQVALFSATMPAPIRKVARRYLREPQEVTFRVKPAAADTIVQNYVLAMGKAKFDTLVRILEFEDTEGVLVFAKTKVQTVELSDRLEAAGFRSAALNGDLAQRQREHTVSKLKSSKIDIVVATDVAARGLDVERISHVINYDCPHDTEAYVHRIGRTGRAGRTGQSLIFLTPREKRFLNTVENTTKQRIQKYQLPTVKQINQKRKESFAGQIQDAKNAPGLDVYRKFIQDVLEGDADITALDVAVSLMKRVSNNAPPLLEESILKHETTPQNKTTDVSQRAHAKGKHAAANRFKQHDIPMQTFYLKVGSQHGVTPGNIVGAIANEAFLESQFIGNIDIFTTYSTVDLPQGMPKEVFKLLKKAWVCEQQLRISKTPFDGDGKSKVAHIAGPRSELKKPNPTSKKAQSIRPRKKNRKAKQRAHLLSKKTA